MSEFKREHHRYIVIKGKDISPHQHKQLIRALANESIPTRECVVVEPDWPNYEQTWRDIEAVENGTFVERKEPVWIPSVNEVCLLGDEQVKIKIIKTDRMKVAGEHLESGKNFSCHINNLTPIAKTEPQVNNDSQEQLDGSTSNSEYLQNVLRFVTDQKGIWPKLGRKTIELDRTPFMAGESLITIHRSDFGHAAGYLYPPTEKKTESELLESAESLDNMDLRTAINDTAQSINQMLTTGKDCTITRMVLAGHLNKLQEEELRRANRSSS